MSGGKEGVAVAVTSDIPYRPCLGCGFCCKKASCALGFTHYGYERPCPALVSKDGRYWCRFVLEADPIHRQKLVDWLYIGEGCCCSLNSDRTAMLKQKRSTNENQKHDP